MEFLECGVCYMTYNDEHRLPRCLSCGHSLCSSCLNEIFSQRQPLSCPYCRVPHLRRVRALEEVPVNYSMLSVLSRESRRNHELVPTQEDTTDEVFQFVKHEVLENLQNIYNNFEGLLSKLCDYHELVGQQDFLQSQVVPSESHVIIPYSVIEVDSEMKAMNRSSKLVIKRGNSVLRKLNILRKLLQDCTTFQELVLLQNSILTHYEDMHERKLENELRLHQNLQVKYDRVRRDILPEPTTSQQTNVKNGLGGVGSVLFFLLFAAVIFGLYVKHSSSCA